MPESLNSAGVGSYKIEGIGYDFIPRVLDRSVVDQWVKTEDRESFVMSRRLIREEGLLCGGSCGSAVVGAIQAAKSLLQPGQRCVVLLADSVRNYMSKFLNDTWMYENGFVDEQTYFANNTVVGWWAGRRVADLVLNTPITVTPDVSCRECIDIMSSQGFDMIPVQSEEDGKVVGVLTEGNLTSMITRGRVNPEDASSKAMYKQFKQVNLTTKLCDLATIFDR